MNEPVAYRQRVHDLEDVVRAMVPEDEYITNIDLVVSTRVITDPSKGRSHRFALPGMDPEVSLGKLMAATDRLRAQLIQRQQQQWQNGTDDA